jgi:hypothetical protein
MATFSLVTALNEVPVDQQSRLQTKLNGLREVLKVKYNMTLRDDSRLAWIYATQLPETELDSISCEIWNTKLLYEYTNYGEICRDILPMVKFSMIRGSEDPLVNQRTWEHIQNFVLPSIQLDCMERLMKNAKMI